MFGRIREFLDRLFERQPEWLPGSVAYLDDEALSRRVTELAGETARMGEVNILNLDEARERIGEKWLLVSRHIHLLIENVLSHRVGGNGFFFQCEEGIYGIVFSADEQDRAEERCAEIEREIMQHLFGDVGLEEETEGGADDEPLLPLAIRAKSFTVDTSELVRAPSPGKALRAAAVGHVHQLNDEAARIAEIESMITYTERRFDALAQQAMLSGSPVLIRRLDTLTAQLRSLERSLSAVMRPVTDFKMEASTKMVPVSSSAASRYENEGDNWQQVTPDNGPMQRLARMIRKAEIQIAEIKRDADKEPDVSREARGETEPKEGEREAGVPRGAEVLEWQSLPGNAVDFALDFVPLVELQTSLKGIYMVRPRFRWGGAIYEPHELLKLEGEPEILTIADRLSLRHFMQMKIPESGVTPVHITSVHQSTLEVLGTRRSYVEVASQLPQNVQRLLILRLVLDAHWRRQNLMSWLEILSPYFRGFILEFPIDDLPSATDLTAMLKPSPRQAKIMSLGFQALSGARGVEVVPEAARRLVDVANDLKVRTFIPGVEDAQLARQCKEIGVRSISSLRYFPAKVEPGGMGKVDLTNLLFADDASAKTASQR